MNIIIMGIQGSGKSTQGKILSDKLHIPYISSGQVFRELSQENSPSGQFIKETINQGKLIPDDKVMPIVEEYLNKPDFNAGFILDGVPRTLEQAQRFQKKIDIVFYFTLSDKEALWRLAHRNDNRDDETLGAVLNRIALFHAKTEPILEYYKQQGKLVIIDGDASIESISRQMLDNIPQNE